VFEVEKMETGSHGSWTSHGTESCDPRMWGKVIEVFDFEDLETDCGTWVYEVIGMFDFEEMEIGVGGVWVRHEIGQLEIEVFGLERMETGS